MENINDHIAETIRKLREKSFGGKGMSQTELANRLKKTPNTISRWETGEYKPKIEDLYEISKFFKVSVLTFFPQELGEQPENSNQELYFRGNTELDARDKEEIQNFIDFRLAQKKLEASQKKTSGRKRKNAIE